MRRRFANRGELLAAGLAMLALVVLVSGCASVKRMAVNQVGDALAGGGTTFARDNDPELVKAAAPFSLKLMESLLAESPRHRGLLEACASGFTEYAYAFVQEDADELEESDIERAEGMRVRARRLYLRARDYGLRGLEVAHPGFGKELRADPKQGVQVSKVKDVGLLYWTAVAWSAAISLSKDNPELIAELPMPEALIDRALALDEKYGDGAIHGFLVTYELSRPNASVGAEERARKHFARTMELSGRRQAGPLVSLAEAVSVQKQDVAEFDSLLKQALAINPDEKPEWRLANLVAQRRAKWLLSRKEQLFLKAGAEGK